jgi:hypothetical protein
MDRGSGSGSGYRVESIQRDKMNKLMANEENKLKEKFQQFFENDRQLPLWTPDSGPDEIQSHITSLKIPCTSAEHPSLLLHNLGQPSHDPKLATRVGDLFDSTKM